MHLISCLAHDKLYFLSTEVFLKRGLDLNETSLLKKAIYNLLYMPISIFLQSHKLVRGALWGKGDPFGSISTSPVSIKSLVSHSEISCLLSQTLWRGVNPSQLHLTQKPHTKHLHSCFRVCVCVIIFLFAVFLFVHHVKTEEINRIAVKQNQSKWETLSVLFGLSHHTERHLVRVYCPDNQNASCNAIITQQHPRQLYYTHSKGHITLLTRTQRGVSLKAAGHAGRLSSW